MYRCPLHGNPVGDDKVIDGHVVAVMLPRDILTAVIGAILALGLSLWRLDRAEGV